MHFAVEKKLEKLQKYKSSNIPVLTVYLGRNGKKTPNTAFLLSQFRSVVKKTLTKEEIKAYKKYITQIKSFLEDSMDTRNTRSVILLTGDNFFEALEFEFYVSPSLTVSRSPYLEPLLDAIKEHNKYFVLLADREKARLFTVHLGRIEEHLDFLDESVPQRVKQIHEAWARGNKITRHIEDHLHRHLKLITQKTKEFAKHKDIRFLILGGHRNLFNKIKELLPKDLRDKVYGTFVTELNIPVNDVFLHSKKIAERIGGIG